MPWGGLSFLSHLFRRQAKPSRPPIVFNAPEIQFVGEQTGPVEDELKERFCEVFDQSRTVSTAYLARLSYDDSPGYSVALCIHSANGLDERLHKTVGEIFAATFKSSESLDIISLRDGQEQELRKVCRPFYEAVRPSRA